ncbi:glyceraldehyde-3-phosphate dehydrogenase [Sulfitobacter sp. F26169L]|uniref:type I glyceraldehyde-3-phosphate dehydrogenase n=1 Tax=Sulfitobacter sp. F26169L TaxID=2996015 RepID=UPI002260AE6E|nr:glyceraldehyde 3-phosphate dehydrogenase NAD-binding domain-containing protein [Sulfitobacter sp. F26169L]MCX7568181.1 glyceraldehyde-3-phosphate dehydrogenase [Sulfitobacter sp. F26169L]
MRIVINGFGRIGRTILRQILTQPGHSDIDVALINDIAPLETCAYLFKYDSTFGPLPFDVIAEEGGLRIDGKFIRFSALDQLSGTEVAAADVVLECTGKVHSRASAERGLKAGAGAVLISGPSGFADTTIVMGANEQSLGDARIVSNSSCTTNAIAPMLNVINSKFGIARAHVTTIHCYTSSQPMVDAPRGDLARSRAGAESMVPTTTSAAKELEKVLPDLGARTSVAAVRVPSLSVSAIDATLQLDKPLSGDVVDALRTAVAGLPAIIGTTDDPCVSRDMRGRAESLILALPEVQTIGDTQLRIFGWYDNEWGFSARMIDMARRMANRQA